MKKFSLSERDIDRLLSGRHPADGSEDRLAAFLGSARRVLLLPPDEKTEAAHLRVMLAAARPRPSATIVLSGTRERTDRRSPFLRLRSAAAKVAIGALGLTTSAAGLAMAGVDLPGTIAEKAFGAVGVTLPNQGQDGAGSENASETSKRVRDAVRGRDGSMTGCEFGASVSRAARGVSDEGDPEHCNPPGRDKAGKKGRAGSARGPKPQPPGRANEHPGAKSSNAGTGGRPSGRDATKGKGGTPPDQTTEDDDTGTTLDEPTTPGTGGDPGAGGTPAGDAKKQGNSGASPGPKSGAESHSAGE